MGIYIHGVSMPKNGEMLVLCVGYNGKVLHPIEFATEDFLFAETGKTAIELPPHGRLGDLDALERNLREMADYQHGDRQQGILGCCSTICSAPTIITAAPEGGADG